MTIFIDASVIVAILGEEPGYERLAAAVDADEDRLTSGIAVWEAAHGLGRDHGDGLHGAAADVAAFIAGRDIRIVDIGWREADVAVEASASYGKGRHPARLNLGDCFAYACAQENSAALLYKGDDFALTDLA